MTPLKIKITDKKPIKSKFIKIIYIGIKFILLLICPNSYLNADSADHPFRIAFTSSMFSQVNENDAKAAMKAWISTVAKDRGIEVDPDPHIHRTVEELLETRKTLEIDGYAVITPEFARLRREIKFDRIAVGFRSEKCQEEYLLLVHQDSKIERLEQLKGVKINVLQSPRMSLVFIWLDTVLLEAGLNISTDFFGKIIYDRNPSNVAVPVFFRQIDGCIMTRLSFEVMGELNPQLKKKLKIIASSPELIPSLFAFCADNNSPFIPKIIDSMNKLDATQAGRQILILTQADRIRELPVSWMDKTIELIDRRTTLLSKSKRGSAGKSSGNTKKKD